ncbi:hypothetical protein [Bacillus suaedaesalsae]|uniref:Sporulation protein n=1 Tax=Bacillus suaedaesalsae TaxID=2810349 RepID=A0ABS2DE90_9BACI|nr:hypothetical protein [Bacillus suaedaesalsae]MBM6616767.1 hypothetical protein [Bacillus suaedaesalsae]
MRIILLFCISLLVAMSTACSNVETTEDANGKNLMKTGTNKDGFYERDLGEGEQFIPNQSSTNYIDVTESRPNIGTDQDKIREVIDMHKNVTPGSVFINGQDAYVTVHSTKSFNEKDRDKLRHKLLKDITKAVPRYHIHVRVHDGDGD